MIDLLIDPGLLRRVTGSPALSTQILSRHRETSE